MNYHIDPHVERLYRIKCYIGGGAYGVVWKGIDRKSGRRVALKKVFDAFSNSMDSQRTYREAIILSNIEHPNIVELLGVIRSHDSRDLYLVFELLESDLSTVIKSRLLQGIQRQFIVYQLIRCCDFLHRRRIIHRDLKPPNILVNHDCSIKLADFGLARTICTDLSNTTNKGSDGRVQATDQDTLTEYIATRWYRSPELLVGNSSYSCSVDIWAIGCIIAELFLCEPLLQGTSASHQLFITIKTIGEPTESDIVSWNSPRAQEMVNELPPIDQEHSDDVYQFCCPPLAERLEHLPRDAADLIVQMLRHNPSKRITAKEALSHPFVSVFATSDVLSDSDAECEEFKAMWNKKGILSDDHRYTFEEYRSNLYRYFEEKEKLLI
eukprot:Tbor_TRINITY_DN5622_c0_g1::TRINITY_DN5622_c0_g1_i3::g.8484::m.8484/K19603/MAPK15; mitogen-activated protein kinase 15